jgi:glycine/D-amino acid oxidase-like deaminating enzyme
VQATVESIAGEGDSVRIMTSLGNLTSGHAVIALNAWSDTLVPELSGLVVPVRGQILSYEPVPDVFRTAVGVDVTPTGEYWQQLRDGSIVIGGCRELAPGADVGIREMVPTKHLTDRIERILPDLFPELSSLKVARRWAGLMAFTSDRLPVADLVPGVEHAWVAGGFSGHGMTFGPRLGQLLADAVTTGSRPAVLESLRIDRPSLCRMAERA